MEHRADICGVEHVKWLDNGVRKFLHNPQRLFGRYVKPGATALDIGCGPGAFTAPLARMVGEAGRVVAIDVQKEMLDLVSRKIEAAGMTERVKLHQCTGNTLGISTPADFILTFYMVHECPDPMRLVDEIAALLKPGGFWFLAEPKMHVSKPAYCGVVERARARGLRVVEERGVISRVAVFSR